MIKNFAKTLSIILLISFGLTFFITCTDSINKPNSNFSSISKNNRIDIICDTVIHNRVYTIWSYTEHNNIKHVFASRGDAIVEITYNK